MKAPHVVLAVVAAKIAAACSTVRAGVHHSVGWTLPVAQNHASAMKSQYVMDEKFQGHTGFSGTGDARLGDGRAL